MGEAGIKTQKPGGEGREETRKRQQMASPGHSGGMEKVPMKRWAKRNGHASCLQLGGSLTAKFCLGLYVSSVICPPATSS